jgi:hexosaminidase
VSIQDRPRFRWRGLLIDSARHFQPLDVIRRNLDAMAAVKLNVLHWHLSDNQGFRIESKRYPKLHGLGSDGHYYTQDEVRGVIAYAQARGIRVVPEFDMPGHGTSWLVGHPELGSAPGPYAIERKPGVMDPTLDPTREEVYRFLDRFLGEMAALFPDAYLHIGGDENEGKHWAANPRIQAFMQRAHGLQDKHALQAYFNRRPAEDRAAARQAHDGLGRDLPARTCRRTWWCIRGAAARRWPRRRGRATTACCRTATTST